MRFRMPGATVKMYGAAENKKSDQAGASAPFLKNLSEEPIVIKIGL